MRPMHQAIAVAVLAALVLTAGGIACSSTPSSPPRIGAARGPAVSPTPGVSGRVGQRVEYGGVALTVVSVSRTTRIGEYTEARAGYTFLVADVMIETTDRDSAPYNPLYFKIKDGDGYEYTTAFSAPDPYLKSGDLAKGEKVRGNVAFEVPASASHLTLFYEPLVLFGGYGPIRITIE